MKCVCPGCVSLTLDRIIPDKGFGTATRGICDRCGRTWSDLVRVEPRIFSCPFCKTDESVIISETDCGENIRGHADLVVCGNCGTQGPWGDNEEHAIELWNAAYISQGELKAASREALSSIKAFFATGLHAHARDQEDDASITLLDRAKEHLQKALEIGG